MLRNAIPFVVFLLGARAEAATVYSINCDPALNIKGVPGCWVGEHPGPGVVNDRIKEMIECKPRECVLRVYEDVPSSSYHKVDNPPCKGGYSEALSNAVSVFVLAKTKNPAVAQEVGPVVAQATAKGIDDVMKANDGLGSLGDVLYEYSSKEASCTAAILTVPKGSRVTRFRLAASDEDHDESNGVGLCGWDQGNGCRPRAYSTWENVSLDPQNGVLSGVFKNWRHDAARKGIMMIWFTPPKRWKPVVNDVLKAMTHACGKPEDFKGQCKP